MEVFMKGIVIAGPTGVGKTDLSLKLAKELDCYIISSDSAQVYKDMNIGTAKILEEEMKGIKHFMLDIVEPISKYSVGDYQKEVDKILQETEKENKNIILTGGTGLYIGAITEGLSDLPSGDENLRKELSKLSTNELYEKLKVLDCESIKNIHINNRKRLERALEVCLLTGKKFSELSKQNIKNNNYSFLKVCLTRDRENLYKRIDKRVDIMVENGLVEEVKNICEKYSKEIIKKINIIGYSEIIDYFNGEISLEEAISNIKRNSRRYAKRQLTWFRNQDNYIWFNLDEESEESILIQIKNLFYRL
ncbi:MAG: tRNA (adenosine(37)-N6)-dimethylallyltransferase MiaA [Fusobacterium perfoetens]|nr:tRNA (adenosine(37)-N6)-dimethylallyltransferase MiaA [Fusobacterium perfoetens]MCI6151797.1 tRNA (adenosine(37)-N6)-dimethylallyltransferase MiaA [Fusobacterium perfoetens]MDY3236842.1 tRNA (adenosine(37)-N6)-dimethylallyltransferase MiaA [Fusobacterium perfoetens]